MAPLRLAPTSGRYLSFTEREEIAVLRAAGHGVRQVAAVLGRSPSTVSRELRRNAATRGGRLDYRASVAQWHCELRARRPKPTKLAVHDVLREYVQDRLSGLVARPDGTTVTGPTVAVDRAPARATGGPALGAGVEPGADRRPVADRLPR